MRARRLHPVATSSLPTRQVGRTPVRVTVMGLGGAPYAKSDDAPSERESRELIARAFDGGIRHFDTAPLYGIGLSERRLGNGLRYVAGSDYTISTKVGRYLVPSDTGGRRAFSAVIDYSYDATMRALEQSLQRLGLNRVDILLIHDLDIWTHGTRDGYEERFREAMEGAYPALASLRAQGVVSAIGIGVNEIEPCLRFAGAADPDCFMLAGRYTLLEQEALNELLPLCEQRTISVLVAGPFNSGILATGAAAGAQYNYRPAPAAVFDRVRKLQAVAQHYDVPIAACALQFPLAHPAVAAVVPGAFTVSEVETNLALLATPIPPALWAELKDRGLLRADASLPQTSANSVASRIAHGPDSPPQPA